MTTAEPSKPPVSDPVWDEAEAAIAEALKSNQSSLALREERLQAIPNSIGRLTGLRQLFCGPNAGFTAESNRWVRLSRMALMDQSAYPATFDIRAISSLSSLEQLDLCYRAHGGLEPLAGLANLRALCLEATDVADLEPLCSLSNLESLSLADNPDLIDLRPLSVLKRLAHLDLSGCPLIDTEQLQQLAGLQSLTLSEQTLSLKTLDTLPALRFLSGGSIEGVPRQLLVGRENRLLAVRQWRKDLQLGEVQGRRVKLLILGNGGVGKTQIARRLAGLAFDRSQPSTHGIDLSNAVVSKATTGPDSTSVHIWDFGGQEIYHGAHSLFLDDQAIYLIAWTPASETLSRASQVDPTVRHRPLQYWLDFVHANTGPAVPVVIAQSKCDREADAVQVPTVGTSAFPWHRAVACSALTESGMDEVVISLRAASRLVHERRGTVRIPTSWLRIEHALLDEATRNRSVTHERFAELCTIASVGSQPEFMLEYFHNCGLLFHRSGILRDAIVLDLSWAFAAIYAVFDRGSALSFLRRNHGRFGPDDLARLAWSRYSEPDRSVFLQMMHQCSLCLSVGNAEYLAPDLLPDDRDAGDSIARNWVDADADCTLELTFPFLHDGLLRAIVGGLGLILGPSGLYWKYGALGVDQHTEARLRVQSFLSIDSRGAPVPNGGRIRIEAIGKSAAFCVERVHNMIARRSGDRPPSVTAYAALDRGDSEAPLDAQAAPVVYLSYRRDETGIQTVARLQSLLERKGFDVRRDTNRIRKGASIEMYKQELARSRKVLLLLSDSYLRSRHCIDELCMLIDRYKGDNAGFLLQAIPIIVGEFILSSIESRVSLIAFWKDRRRRLERRLGDAATPNLSAELDLLSRRIASLTVALEWIADSLCESSDQVLRDECTALSHRLI